MPTIVVNGQELDFKLALFDLDGTLIDDKPRYTSLASFRMKEVEKRGGRKAAIEWAALSGFNYDSQSIDMGGAISKAPRREDIAIAAAAIYKVTGKPWHESRALAEEAYEEADTQQTRIYKPVLFHGVKEVLKEMKKAGFSLGIATNGPKNIANELLMTLGIDELFQVVIGGDDVSNAKPAPDMIKVGCVLCGVKPSEAIYVGDQRTDAEAAKNAGCAAAITVGAGSYLQGSGFKELIAPSVASFIVANPA